MHGSSAALRVLVVDGDASNSRSTRDALQWDRYDVSVASTAEEALAMARCAPPDIVIIGASLVTAMATALRVGPLSQLPVIALSSDGDAPAADAVLRTPLDALELLATVRLLVRQGHRR